MSSCSIEHDGMHVALIWLTTLVAMRRWVRFWFPLHFTTLHTLLFVTQCPLPLTTTTHSTYIELHLLRAVNILGTTPRVLLVTATYSKVLLTESR